MSELIDFTETYSMMWRAFTLIETAPNLYTQTLLQCASSLQREQAFLGGRGRPIKPNFIGTVYNVWTACHIFYLTLILCCIADLSVGQTLGGTSLARHYNSKQLFLAPKDMISHDQSRIDLFLTGITKSLHEILAG